MEPKLIMALSSVCFMLIVVVLAWFDAMLLPSQQLASKVWLPVVSNGSIWANMVLISIALYVIGTYTDQWSNREIVLALVLGIVVSWALWCFIYQNGKYMDGLAQPYSLAGRLTMIYGGAVIAAIVLFYFRTSATYFDIMVVGVLLALYIPIANHVVLDWLNSRLYFMWCPDIFVEEASPLRFIIGGEILVFAATVVKLKVWQLI